MTDLHHLLDPLGGFATFIIILVIWSLIWKGIGLWYAARNSQKAWYVAILILNSAGILEIIYLLFFRRDRQPETKSLFERPLPVESANS